MNRSAKTPSVTAQAAGARRRSAEEAAERRRGELIEAAYLCFANRGYTATGVQDITARLGLAVGTFYRYFENKRAILDDVIDHGLERWLSDLGDELSPSAETLDEFRANVEKLAHRILDRTREQPALIRIILFEGPAIDAEANARVLGLIDIFGTITSTYIRGGVDRGFLRSDLDVDKTAKLVNGMVMAGLLELTRAELSDADARAYVDALIATAIDGLRGPPA